MKFVRITLSKGAPFTLPYEQAMDMLNSPQQIILLQGEDGEWSGQTINKAHIVCTDRDSEAEASWKSVNVLALPEGEAALSKEGKEENEKIERLKNEIGKKFKA